MKVLVLEDDENLRELLCETLDDEGYQASGAANGLEALHKVSSELFDVLVVDVRMEGMSGLEAFAQMRQQGVELACLVITGYATEEDSIRAIRLGVGDYLRKPFEMRELLLRLARITAVFQRQRESHSRESRLQFQLDWLCRLTSSPGAWETGQLAGQIASCLQLDRLHALEVQVAAVLARQGLQVDGADHWVGEGLDNWRENWDGSGPLGLAGESIPLAGRIVRLAVVVAEESASGLSASPQQLARTYAGQIDPHLLFCLELQGAQEERKLRRLLDLAQGLLHTGQTQEAGLALQEAEKLACGPQMTECQLLLAGLEPGLMRSLRLKRLVESSQSWGSAWEGRVLLESALLLIECQPEQAVAWLREAYPRLDQEALKALAQLGLWVLGQAPQWSPGEAIAVLLQPQHEPRLFRVVSWLGLPVLLWWLSQTREHPVILRFFRHYAGPLVSALGRLSPAQRGQLWEKLQTVPQGTPSSWLQALVQEPYPRLRSLAVQLSSRASEPARPPALHIRSFGAFRVYVAGRPIPDKAYRGFRNKLLMAYVASFSRPVPEEKVREVFWPDELEKGRKGLYNAMFYLRKAFRPEDWGGDCDYFLRQRELIGLDPDLEPWHDLWEVEKSLSFLRGADWPTTQSELDKILPLLEGGYLDGCYLDWAVERRQSLELQLTEALLSGCQKALEHEAWTSALDWSQRSLELDFTNQAAACHRMRALCQLGRPEEAVRMYEGLSRKLQAEYEMEPTLELVEWLARARAWM